MASFLSQAPPPERGPHLSRLTPTPPSVCPSGLDLGVAEFGVHLRWPHIFCTILSAPQEMQAERLSMSGWVVEPVVPPGVYRGWEE